MKTGDDIRTEPHARAILKLAADAAPSTWRAAFQREVKAAHPDRGGDPERFRLVIQAYAFLKTVDVAPRRPVRASPRPRPSAAAAARAQPAPRPEPRPEPDVEVSHDPLLRLSIVEAFRGCEKSMRGHGGKQFKIRLPAGLQTGDVVRFGAEGEHRATIAVTPIQGAELQGADLWLTVAVSAEFLKEGGRMEVDTPLGARKFWVSRTSASRGLYRAPGEGLPARAARPRGHLYLKFELDESLNQSSAKSLLARFAAVWTSA